MPAYEVSEEVVAERTTYERTTYERTTYGRITYQRTTYQRTTYERGPQVRKTATLDFLIGSVLAFQLLSPLGGGRAFAQDARVRQEAADAYDQGSAAFLAQRYPRAAVWFERAHRLAPSAPALLQAVRSHDRAGHTLRAANLALEAMELYPDDENTSRVVAPILDHAMANYGRVRVICEACEFEVDGSVPDQTSFFVDAGPHEVGATFASGTIRERWDATIGVEAVFSFEAPPALASSEDIALERSDSERRRGVPRAATLVSIGLTATAGAALLWSGIDTLRGVDAYEADPTPERLSDGQDRERRTDILLGVTCGLSAATIAMALFTRWSDGDEEAPATVSAAASPDGVSASIHGHF